MTRKKKQWSDLTPPQKALLLSLISVELALTATALADLVTRPAAQVRGPKLAWGVGIFVQPVGPIAYLTVGRKRVATA